MDWTGSELNAFFEGVEENRYATSKNLPFEWSRAAGTANALNTGYQVIRQNNIKLDFEHFVYVFSCYTRARAFYLAAWEIAASQRFCTATPLLRQCLENSLLGLHFYKNPSVLEKWLDTPWKGGQESMEEVFKWGKKFTFKKMLKQFKTTHDELFNVGNKIYNFANQYGAHASPDFYHVTMKIDRDKNEIASALIGEGVDSAEDIKKQITYISKGGLFILLAYQIIFENQFEESGLTNRIAILKQGL